MQRAMPHDLDAPIHMHFNDSMYPFISNRERVQYADWEPAFPTPATDVRCVYMRQAASGQWRSENRANNALCQQMCEIDNYRKAIFVTYMLNETKVPKAASITAPKPLVPFFIQSTV
jgi:hypothetical protein